MHCGALYLSDYITLLKCFTSQRGLRCERPSGEPGCLRAVKSVGKHMLEGRSESRAHTIHSFIPDNPIAPLQIHYDSEALPTTALILCRNQHAEPLQATVSEGLAQGPYVSTRVGIEPETLRKQGTELNTEPSRPQIHANMRVSICECLSLPPPPPPPP